MAFPTGILAGAHVSFYDWWVWNQIPVTIGNILGAMVLNGTLWYYTHTLAEKSGSSSGSLARPARA